jgi:hypothetical protein
MNSQKNILISLIFNIIGVVSVLLIIVYALLSLFISPSSSNFLFIISSWVYDSYVFILTFGLIAIIGFVVSGIFEFKQNGIKSKLLSRIGKITGMLALLALPSASLVGQLFCTKTLTGTGCDLSSIGLVVYFIVGAIVLSVVSIISFTLSVDYKKNERSKIIH